MISVPEGQRSSFTEDYLKIWDLSGRTGGRFSLRDHNGRAPAFIKDRVLETGASFLYQGETAFYYQSHSLVLDLLNIQHV